MRPWILPCLAAVLTACAGPPPAPEEPADPDVLATWDSGAVRRGDLDRAILELPPGQRALAGKGVDWFEELVRDIAVEALLLAEVEQLALAEDPQVAARLAEARRQLLMERFRERRLPAPEPVSDAELRQAYEAAGERFELGEARQVRHLFQRRDRERGIEAQRAEVAALRRRLAAGETFASLAAEHSDSESRHRGGDLGLMRRGQLPPPLEKVIFALPEGEPSEPLLTAEGIHLFLVEKVHAARSFGFDEVRTALLRELQGGRREAAFEAAVAALPPLPPGGFLASAEELSDLVAAGDPQALVLRAGDFEQRLAGLLDRLQQMEAPVTPDAAAELARQLERRERAVRWAAAAGWLEEEETAAAWRHRRDGLLIAEQRRRRLEQQIDRDPQRLRDFYERNAGRFGSPLSLRLRFLRVPRGTEAEANTRMARLEALAADGTAELTSAAAELGGDVEDLDWLPLPALAATLPEAARRVAGLAAGQRTPPFQGDEHLALVEVLERREPTPEPFAQVLDAVRRASLESHGQELYREWSAHYLEAAGFRLIASRITNLPPTAPPAAEEY